MSDQVEIEVEIEAPEVEIEVEVDAEVQIEVEIPEVEIPEVEVEVEIEIEIEAPEIQLEVAVEVDVEVPSLEFDSQIEVEAPEIETKIAGGMTFEIDANVTLDANTTMYQSKLDIPIMEVEGEFGGSSHHRSGYTKVWCGLLPLFVILYLLALGCASFGLYFWFTTTCAANQQECWKVYLPMWYTMVGWAVLLIVANWIHCTYLNLKKREPMEMESGIQIEIAS
jgi:hypothetical protein